MMTIKKPIYIRLCILLNMVTSTNISVAIIIFLLIGIIIYAIVLFEMYKTKAHIFADYTPPTPPSNYFYPLGGVRPLTQEEIDRKNRIILASINVAPS